MEEKKTYLGSTHVKSVHDACTTYLLWTLYSQPATKNDKCFNIQVRFHLRSKEH